MVFLQQEKSYLFLFATDSVFLGNLSYDADEESLREFFDKESLTASCRVIYKDGRSRGFGYADFDNEEDYNKALAMDGTEHMGRDLRINSADSKPSGGRGRDGRGRGRGRGGGGGGGASGGPQNPPSSSLIVRNLSYYTTEENLENAFQGCTNAKVMVDRETGDSKG